VGKAVAALCLLLLSAPAAADGDCTQVRGARLDACLTGNGWQQVHDDDGIRVYTREHPGSSIREVLARTTVRTEAGALLALLTDFDRYTEFMPATLERSELLAEQDGSYLVFQQLDLPLVDDRYYTIRLRSAADAAGAGLRLSWDLAGDGRRARQGRGSPVRVNRGFWWLKPGERAGETEAVYFVHTDPGEIWPFVANMANRISVPEVVRAVRERAESAAPAAP
jgi:hypothetical protein